MISIIESVEAGVLTPAEAVEETEHLKREAKETGVEFTANYTLGDFILIRENAAAVYEVSDDSEEDQFWDGEDEDDN